MSDTSALIGPCFCGNDDTTGGHYHDQPQPSYVGRFTTKTKWVLSCMHNGPSVMFPDDELADLSCTKQRGHTGQHHWWSDDGTVEVRWEDDWSFAEGEWRQEIADE